MKIQKLDRETFNDGAKAYNGGIASDIQRFKATVHGERRGLAYLRSKDIEAEVQLYTS